MHTIPQLAHNIYKCETAVGINYQIKGMDHKIGLQNCYFFGKLLKGRPAPERESESDGGGGKAAEFLDSRALPESGVGGG